MGMQLHELHPSLVHLPLGVLPLAAGVDLAAALSGDRTLDRTGRILWAAGTAGGLLAGAAIGLLQGAWTTKLRVPSFIVTLAGLLAWQGVLLRVLGGAARSI